MVLLLKCILKSKHVPFITVSILNSGILNQGDYIADAPSF